MAKMTMKDVKILGVKEVLELLKIADPDMPGDSYGTHLENPQTMNEADFSFTIGESDWEYLKTHEVAMERFCKAVMAYFVLEMSDGKLLPYAGSYMDILNMISDSSLNEKIRGGIMYLVRDKLPYFNDILEWIDSLPDEEPVKVEKAEEKTDE